MPDALAARRTIALLLLLAARHARAGATFTVDVLGDGADQSIDGTCATAQNHCTLRAAVMEANATTGATIVLGAGLHTLSLPDNGLNDASGGDLDVTSNTTIAGAGAAQTIVDGGALGERIFQVAQGVTLDVSRLTLQNATISGSQGGGISVGGTLHMSDSRITNCHGTAGGGLHVTGTATLTRVTIDGCSATHPTGGGGAIQLDGVSLTVTDSTLSGNGSPYYGGAVNVATGNARLVRCTVSANTAYGGGGLFCDDVCTIVNSTFSGNNAIGNGGGIYDVGVTAVYGSTITANRADSNSDLVGIGGGVHGGTGTGFLNTIVAGNKETATLAIARSDARDPLGGVVLVVDGDCAGTLASQGYNLVKAYSTACTINGSPPTIADPVLDALKDNGGYTRTHLPLPGSPTIGAGNPNGCSDDIGLLAEDQRRVKRPIGAACDIGAVEVEPKGDANGDGAVNVSDVLYLINFLFAGGPPPLGRANVNGDGAVNVSDVLYLINYLFAGGPAPA